MHEESKLRGKTIFLLYFFLSIVIIGLVLILVFNISDKKLKKIPRIDIVLNEVSLDEVNSEGKDKKYYNNKMIVSDGKENRYFDDVEFKGRGNASWQMRKKSYRIKLNQQYNLLNLGKVKKWGLISNGIDDSLLRNDLAYYIARVVDSSYRIKGDFVRLYVDKKDLGLYYLVKLIDIDKESVDLREPTGVMVELDNAYCDQGEDWYNTKLMKDCLALNKTVANDDSAIIGWKTFIDKYDKFEDAIANGDYEEANKYMDMTSLANFYLVGEFASDPDIVVTSWHMYMDGIDDKIHCVVAWDFDAAFGNKNWGEWDENFYNPYNDMIRIKYSFEEKEDYIENNGMGCKYNIDDVLISPILCYAIDMPEFMEEVNRTYKEKLQNKRDEVIGYIRDKADYIREAAIRNNEIWGKGDFDEAVDYLIWWVEERFNYFDENYVDASAAIEL